ncbi:MAG: family 78 glycoside hydrolase catalytic domain [Eubacteriales bacterium]|nr:family 78 glycoside hydrolase catalytic domain [Eubacteriales bacterium]
MSLKLALKDLVVEHQKAPLGIDCRTPRFGWKLVSSEKNVFQTAYRIRIYSDDILEADTGRMESRQSIEVTVPDWKTRPMTSYRILLKVWDNYGNRAEMESGFETGRLGTAFVGGWVEPEQIPTENSWKGKTMDTETVGKNSFAGKERDFAEFQPAQYIRIPFQVKKALKKARVYVTAHGLYQLEINGCRVDSREFAPENTSYHKILQYQTYDVTGLLQNEENVFGVILGDGWWAGRVGVSGDSCQYGDKLGLLLEAELTYEDGTVETICAERGVSSTGPILYSDLFVGEKYDAGKEMAGWSCPGFDDSGWKPVKKAEYSMDNLIGQYAPPVRTIKCLVPKEILRSPKGEVILDVGQVVAGHLEFTLEAAAGISIRFEHSEILDEEGNYFHNILGSNKEQMDVYITKEGRQTYRPHFTYHGFRYVRISGWPGDMTPEQFKVHVLSSEMEDIGHFETSEERINRLQKNIWWSQVANTISIPTDCPQREKAGWTGDIMAYSPTLCFLRNADAFLTGWMANVRADQLEDGAVPMIVPYLKAYEIFIKHSTNTDTSCGWGDAVIVVPYAVYQAYGDRQILEENYDAMKKWMGYIRRRAANFHPKGYENWSEERKERSRYLWNTDFHYGDWLIPSLVLGNPDGSAMMQTAYKTMGIVAPAYYAFSARTMVKVAEALGQKEDAAYYRSLYEKIRAAFIAEYVREDGTMEADFQGIYVIALKNGLVTEEVRPLMVGHLCDMIEKNNGCLDTGFLSIPFLMDVLCENGKRDVAYRLMFQTKCPSWLYEVEKGATTMWESWGAIGEDGTVSTYSYNHYAFGCVGEWMYREMGGLQAAAPGYRKIRIAPALDCGLRWASVKEETPYGEAFVSWRIEKEKTVVSVEIPANTTAEIVLPGRKTETVGSGSYTFQI